MEKCDQYLTYGYEEMFFCERERGHDGPHRHTEDTPERTMTVEWTPK